MNGCLIPKDPMGCYAPAGVGKSHTVRAIVESLTEKGLKVAVSASSGIAAVNIKGVTVHSLTGVRKGDDPPLKTAQSAYSLKKTRDTLIGLDVLVR